MPCVHFGADSAFRAMPLRDTTVITGKTAFVKAKPDAAADALSFAIGHVFARLPAFKNF